jgi:CRP-like cAMP-binding protein
MITFPDKAVVIDTISSLYSPLNEDCKAELIACSRLLSFEKETVLVKEGQFADKSYFVIKGYARAYYIKDGKDITDWFAFENDFISSIHSFFLNVASPHYIQLLEPALLLEIARGDVQKLSDKYHDFERLGSRIVTKTMFQLQQRIVSMQFETAQQKYESILQIRKDIPNRVPLTHIASYLGITLETLSRIRNPKNRV